MDKWIERVCVTRRRFQAVSSLGLTTVSEQFKEISLPELAECASHHGPNSRLVIQIAAVTLHGVIFLASTLISCFQEPFYYAE